MMKKYKKSRKSINKCERCGRCSCHRESYDEKMERMLLNEKLGPFAEEMLENE